MPSISKPSAADLWAEINGLMKSAQEDVGYLHVEFRRRQSEWNSLMTILPAALRQSWDSGEWEKLDEAKREQITELMIMLRNALRCAAESDGPADPAHVMHKSFASTATILVLAGFGLVGMTVIIWTIRINWSGALEGHPDSGQATSTAPSELAVLSMVILMGLLGGQDGWCETAEEFRTGQAWQGHAVS